MMDWWSLFRVITLLHLCACSTGQAGGQNKSESDGQSDLNSAFMNAVGIKSRTCSQAPVPSKGWQRPKCQEKVGCDKPLHCFNYSSLTENRGAFQVQPHDLERILENPAVMNVCAVVMFYASWCPYSVDFARQFNALGRSFKELLIMAVDFAENDQYKYLTAYIPVVSFYYRGKVIYRFKATESYDELIEQVTKMTDFQPTRVELDAVENEYPVPTVRTDGDTVYLVVATCWIIFVALVSVCRTKAVSEWIFRIFSRLHRAKKD